MKWNTSIPEELIKVKVENGWVTLSGDVEWDFQRQAAYKAVAKLSGVIGVVNNISIKPKITATNVKSEILKAFERNATLEMKGIDVQVSGSKVTLTGTVHSWNERQEAEWAAWAAPGVTDVYNKLEVHEIAAMLADYDDI
jgi:osmotically-inducible protein OsmY